MYTYKLNDVTVHPEGDWELYNEQKEGQIFFRRKLRGELTFRGDDYDTIMEMSDCDVLEFKIYCGSDLHWEGKFKMPYDFEIDSDSCFLKGEPEVVDEYSCVMDYYDDELWHPGLLGGGTTVDLRDCAGNLLYQFFLSAYRLAASSASGFNNYLDQILNYNPGSWTMGCGLTISSSFMFRNDFPNGDNYAAAYGPNNYVTGAGNRLEHLYLLTNTVARTRMGGTICDGIPYYSFKHFERLFRDRFNAYWYIDQNGHFRIEHISFFDPSFPYSDYNPAINLKELISNNKRSYAYRRNKYKYETGRLYDQERFTWQHYEGTEGGVAHGQDFTGVPIFYGAAADSKSDCVPGDFKEKEFTTPYFWTDCAWMWGIAANPPNAAGTGQPDTIKCPGFLMIDVDSATMWIRCEVGALSAANQINGHLSTANLMNHYFQHDRIFLNGDMNSGAVTTFQSAQRHKLQDPIEFTLCCDENYDAMQYIRTEMGDGKVKSATEKKRSVEVELLY